MADYHLLQEIKSRRWFGYAQYDLEVDDYFKPQFAILPKLLQKLLSMSQRWWNVDQKVSRNKPGVDDSTLRNVNFKLQVTKVQNGKLNVHLLSFCLEMCLECTICLRLSEYTLRKSFGIFVQSAIDARKQRQVDEN